MSNELDILFVDTVQELRTWLKEHHEQQESVWLVTWKKGEKEGCYISWGEIVDELLCFGWIDSVPKKRDDGRKMLRIGPRRSGSSWSGVNKKKAAQLEEEGRMTIMGRAMIEMAKKDGSWTRIDAATNLEVPKDLAKALAANPEAEGYFERFPPSSRRSILEWVILAKRPETRARRVAQVVEKAAQNLKANFPEGRDRGPSES